MATSKQFAIRRATESDARECASIVVEAYATTPFMLSIFPGKVDQVIDRYTNYRESNFRKQLQLGKTQFALVVDEQGINIATARWIITEIEHDSAMPSFQGLLQASDMAGFIGTGEMDDHLAQQSIELMVQRHTQYWRGKGRHYRIHSVATRPKFWQMGAAKQLMQYILSEADKDGLPTWLEANGEAEGFYQMLGFQAAGDATTLSSSSQTTRPFIIIPMIRLPAKVV